MDNRPHPTLTEFYPDEAGRRAFVARLFDVNSRHYDAIIRVMSLGTGTWYRGDALGRAGLESGMALLDVACGTGPVAAAGLRRVGRSGRVVALDPSLPMLREARTHAAVPLVQATAEGLPFATASFDVLSMGYALRHVADLDATFREFRRVLRPGGRVLILEWTKPRSRAGLAATRLYLKRVVPALAGLATRSADARVMMRYFWETIETCVPPAAIAGALERAGFGEVSRRVFFGIFSEYTGRA